MTDRDQNNAGRLTHPMVKRPGDNHYQPIEWAEAFQLIADELNALDSPDEATFYTSGKVPNEPAFLFQLFVRQFGTNNLPDCSNMCHESSGAALSSTLGLGKGSVTLNDIHEAEVIMIIGQNPGTNHPRMLSALQKAKQNGAKIISVNPLIEAGLNHFKNPQDFMNPFKALGALHGQRHRNHRPVPAGAGGWRHGPAARHHEAPAGRRGAEPRPGLRPRASSTSTPRATRPLWRTCATRSWEDIEEMSGISRAQLLEAANMLATKKKIITCWAMGLTQQRQGVQTIQELVNLLLLKGAIGKPGAGTCPVRGHSNVQGDRTMGIWEQTPKPFLDALGKEFNFTAPTEHGFDTVDSIKAMHQGKVKVYFGLGGNLLAAGPDTEYIAEAMRKQNLTVFVGTKLNRGHLVTGKTALLLPCFTHADVDMQRSGHQMTSCENSMGVVSQNKGVLVPLPGQMLSEVAIMSGMAIATLGEKTNIADWVAMTENYDVIRDHISRVIPGFENFNEKLRRPGGFYLPNGPRDRKFTTEDGKAHFTKTELEKYEVRSRRADPDDRAQPRPVQHHHLRLQRPVPRHPQRAARAVHERAGHGRPGPQSQGPHRHHQPLQGPGAHGGEVRGRTLRHSAGQRVGLLPRGQPAHPHRQRGQKEQHAHLEVYPRNGGAHPQNRGSPGRAPDGGGGVVLSC